jgi:acyl-CoA reductase-like NAD-dependent aldehyde dehydrogenase
MKVEDYEIFGPVVTVNPYTDTRIHGHRRGDRPRQQLPVRPPERDLHRGPAHRTAGGDRIDVGALIVNDSPTFRVDSMPFGGQKESGLGREGTRYAMEETTDTRLVVPDYS